MHVGWKQNLGVRMWLTFVSVAGCSTDADPPTQGDDVTAEQTLFFAADAAPIRSVEDALKGVFIPPFVECREPEQGASGDADDGQVCTPVSIAGATQSGLRYADYADCDVVRTQRPYWQAPPAAEPDPDDPRLQDATYAEELAWVTAQAQASGCTCCHDSRSMGALKPSQWDIAAGGVWLDTLSDSGLALFAGLADSSVLGAYAPEDNNGFARELTGIPSTEPSRMQAFMLAELAHRGIDEAEARAVPPFGGPIYAQSVAVPGECGAGEGVAPDGKVSWTRGTARYVYVLAQGSANPGVPPDRDRPMGTLWRLDVPANQPAIESGLYYASTPEGTLQAIPERAAAPELQAGERYQLSVLLDVGVPLANCVFTFGEPVREPEPNAPPTEEPIDDGASSLGKVCASDSDCGVNADYCAVLPGQSEGYCTPTGCAEDANVCPEGWSCLDLSAFAADLPSICAAQ